MTTRSSAATDSADRAALHAVTLAALLLVALLNGSIIMETVFGWPGLGLLVVEAVDSRDYPIVQAVVLCLSAMHIGVSLLVDVLHAYLNPKVRYFAVSPGSAVAGRRIFEGAKKVTRTALVGLGVMILSAPVVAAQSPVKAARIGVLGTGTASTHAARDEAFRQGLNDLGYVEGRNIVIEYRYAEGKTERLSALAAELVRLKVDLIVTSGDPGVRAAKQASQTIPIVVALAGDLVGRGHVASLARPGSNITGLTTLGTELSAKRLELLKTAFPKVSRVAILWNPNNADNVAGFKATEVAARALRIQLLPLEVRRADDLEGAFPAALRARADAVIAFGDSLLLTHRARIADFAAKNRLPTMYGNGDYMDAGGLMFYGPNVPDMYRRAATYVDKILKGAKPGDLPVEQPTKLELVVNAKTAKALGLTFPPSFLPRVDRVIE